MPQGDKYMIIPFTDSAHISQLMSVSESFIRELRNEGEWKEGIHWVYLNPKHPKAGLRYNTALCLNWLACRGNPGDHEKAIQAYLEALGIGKVYGAQLNDALESIREASIKVATLMEPAA